MTPEELARIKAILMGNQPAATPAELPQQLTPATDTSIPLAVSPGGQSPLTATAATPNIPQQPNPELTRAKAALAASQAPPGPQTWQQQAGDVLSQFGRSSGMNPAQAQQLEQQRQQTAVENKRQTQQDLISRVKMIQDEDYRQQELSRQQGQDALAAQAAPVHMRLLTAQAAGAEQKLTEPSLGEIPPGGTVYDKTTGKPAFTAPGREPTPKSIGHVNIQDPKSPGKPLQANYDTGTGVTTDPRDGAVIADPRPYHEAGAEPGQYLAITDQQGRVTKWVNPKTKTVITAQELGIGEDAYRGPVSSERQKMQENAKSGLRAIAKLREELKKPGMLASLVVPGSPTARLARAARGEMVDVMTRLRTGAALNSQEQTFYRDQAPGLIDALFADPDTIEYKLSIFENEFKGLAGDSQQPGGTQQPSAGQWKIIGVK